MLLKSIISLYMCYVNNCFYSHFASTVPRLKLSDDVATDVHKVLMFMSEAVRFIISKTNVENEAWLWRPYKYIAMYIFDYTSDSVAKSVNLLDTAAELALYRKYYDDVKEISNIYYNMAYKLYSNKSYALAIKPAELSYDLYIQWKEASGEDCDKISAADRQNLLDACEGKAGNVNDKTMHCLKMVKRALVRNSDDEKIAQSVKYFVQYKLQEIKKNPDSHLAYVTLYSAIRDIDIEPTQAAFILELELSLIKHYFASGKSCQLHVVEDLLKIYESTFPIHRAYFLILKAQLKRSEDKETALDSLYDAIALIKAEDNRDDEDIKMEQDVLALAYTWIAIIERETVSDYAMLWEEDLGKALLLWETSMHLLKPGIDNIDRNRSYFFNPDTTREALRTAINLYKLVGYSKEFIRALKILLQMNLTIYCDEEDVKLDSMNLYAAIGNGYAQIGYTGPANVYYGFAMQLYDMLIKDGINLTENVTWMVNSAIFLVKDEESNALDALQHLESSLHIDAFVNKTTLSYSRLLETATVKLCLAQSFFDLGKVVYIVKINCRRQKALNWPEMH